MPCGGQMKLSFQVLSEQFLSDDILCIYINIYI